MEVLEDGRVVGMTPFKTHSKMQNGLLTATEYSAAEREQLIKSLDYYQESWYGDIEDEEEWDQILSEN